MNIATYNKSLAEYAKKGLNFSFVQEIDPADEEIFYCNDTDTVKYQIVAKKNSFKLIFQIIDLKIIWTYIENYFKAQYYIYFHIKQVNVHGSDAIEITLDSEGLTNINKGFKEKEELGITTGKKQFEGLFDALSKKVASIKRHFMASPYEMMLEVIAANSKDKTSKAVGNLSFYTKGGKKEKTWIAFEKNQFTVYYGISFEDRFEQQLGRVFFSELLDAKKHVQNSPGISVSESQLPKFLIDSFPQEKSEKYSFSNGIVSMTLFGSLVKNPRTIASYLANFRNYAYYHIQASKCYLHSRVLRRINTFYKDLTMAEIEPFTK